MLGADQMLGANQTPAMLGARQLPLIDPKRFWDRYVGFYEWEFELIKEFHNRIRSRANEIIGYVFLLSKHSFLITPLPWLMAQICILCRPKVGVSLPPDGACIHAEGKWRYDLDRKNRVLKEIFEVKHWELASAPHIRPATRFEDVIRDFPWFMDEATRALAILNIISSPAFIDIPGGITKSVFNLTGRKRTSIEYLSDMKRLIPMAKPKAVNVEVARARLKPRYPVEYTFGTTARMSSTTLSILAKEHITRREKCLALAAHRPPDDINYVPFSLSDIPLPLEEEDVPTSRKEVLDVLPELLELALTSHLHVPQIAVNGLNSSLTRIREELVRLVASYDSGLQFLGKRSLLSLNYRERPTSILRAARAFARAIFADELNPDLVMRFCHQYYEPLIRSWIEMLVELMPGLKRLGTILFDLSSRDRMIVKAISRRGTISFQELVRETGMKEYELNQRLEKLLKEAVIYEVITGHYAVVPLDIVE